MANQDDGKQHPCNQRKSPLSGICQSHPLWHFLLLSVILVKWCINAVNGYHNKTFFFLNKFFFFFFFLGVQIEKAATGGLYNKSIRSIATYSLSLRIPPCWWYHGQAVLPGCSKAVFKLHLLFLDFLHLLLPSVDLTYNETGRASLVKGYFSKHLMWESSSWCELKLFFDHDSYHDLCHALTAQWNNFELG